MTIINDTENTIHKLNLQIQDTTTELEAIKMFVKEQFYFIKNLKAKLIIKIDNRTTTKQRI